MTSNEAKKAGMVFVGEFGLPTWPESQVWCRPEDREAVQSAYDSIDDSDLSSGVLDDVLAAGGVYCVEV